MGLGIKSQSKFANNRIYKPGLLVFFAIFPLLNSPHSLSQDESDNDDEMDYDGSTQELLANVDCLLTTDGGNGSQVR